jgi:DNA integrity scanning protein DisA with diadenylate cyclase activity
MSFLDKVKHEADKLKHEAEKLDLQQKADELTKAANKAAHAATEKAGEVAHQQRHKVEEVLEKAGKAVNEKTEGKYADKVATVKDTVAKGVEKLAEHRPGAAAADEQSFERPDVEDVAGEPKEYQPGD